MPWADALYALDPPIWAAMKGAPEFQGVKLTADRGMCHEFGAFFIPLKRHYDHILLPGDEDDWIGDGGNSGFQMLNIAIKRFLKRRIVLIGFDMQGTHWHGKHPKGLNNPQESNFLRWRNVLNAEAPILRAAGIEVYRECDRSLLLNYPILSIKDAIATWR